MSAVIAVLRSSTKYFYIVQVVSLLYLVGNGLSRHLTSDTSTHIVYVCALPVPYEADCSYSDLDCHTGRTIRIDNAFHGLELYSFNYCSKRRTGITSRERAICCTFCNNLARIKPFSINDYNKLQQRCSGKRRCRFRAPSIYWYNEKYIYRYVAVRYQCILDTVTSTKPAPSNTKTTLKTSIETAYRISTAVTNTVSTISATLTALTNEEMNLSTTGNCSYTRGMPQSNTSTVSDEQKQRPEKVPSVAIVVPVLLVLTGLVAGIFFWWRRRSIRCKNTKQASQRQGRRLSPELSPGRQRDKCRNVSLKDLTKSDHSRDKNDHEYSVNYQKKPIAKTEVGSHPINDTCIAKHQIPQTEDTGHVYFVLEKQDYEKFKNPDNVYETKSNEVTPQAFAETEYNHLNFKQSLTKTDVNIENLKMTTLDNGTKESKEYCNLSCYDRKGSNRIDYSHVKVNGIKNEAGNCANQYSHLGYVTAKTTTEYEHPSKY